MRISVFTADGDAARLARSHASLCAQVDAPEWEWLLGAPREAWPSALANDARVRAAPLPQARGEVLLELEAGDEFAPYALSRVHGAIEAGAGFVYSDFCEVLPDGGSHAPDPAFGWESYDIVHGGRTLTAVRAFAPDPGSRQSAPYAPFRLRAWRADAYRASGGHDANGDFDLVCRTYLAGVAFAHLPECLYFRHVRAGEPARTAQANPHFFRLVEEWCRREHLPMLDLGGGHDSPPGYRSVDLVNGDITCDIRLGLPFEDSSVGCVRAYDFLEHMPRCADSSCTHGADGTPRCAVGTMNEIYRVLAPGGVLISRTPSTDGRGAFQDPTHVSFWNPNSFWYYTRREHARFVPGIATRFQPTRVFQGYPNDWFKQHHILYVYADLIALKGQRAAGPTYI